MLSQIPTLMCDPQLSGVPILHEGNRLSYLTGCTANVGKVKGLGGKSLGAEPAVHTMLKGSSGTRLLMFGVLSLPTFCCVTLGKLNSLSVLQKLF